MIVFVCNTGNNFLFQFSKYLIILYINEFFGVQKILYEMVEIEIVWKVLVYLGVGV